MPLTASDRSLLLTSLFTRLRALEAARGLSLDTCEAMQYRLVDALPDPTFGGAVARSSVKRVYTALPDGDEGHDDVRLLTLPAARALAADPYLDPIETEAAMLIATLVLNDAPVYVETQNLEQLDTTILDAAFSGAEGEGYLWMDNLSVANVPMTRCMAALAAPEMVARSRSTAHDGFYARRTPARAADVIARLDASSTASPWRALARDAFARVPSLRASVRHGVELLAPEGRRLLDLRQGLKTPRRPRRVTAGVPALRFQRLHGALSLPQPARNGRPLDRVDPIRDERAVSPVPSPRATELGRGAIRMRPR